MIFNTALLPKLEAKLLFFISKHLLFSICPMQTKTFYMKENAIPMPRAYKIDRVVYQTTFRTQYSAI